MSLFTGYIGKAHKLKLVTFFVYTIDQIPAIYKLNLANFVRLILRINVSPGLKIGLEQSSNL